MWFDNHLQLLAIILLEAEEKILCRAKQFNRLWKADTQDRRTVTISFDLQKNLLLSKTNIGETFVEDNYGYIIWVSSGVVESRIQTVCTCIIPGQRISPAEGAMRSFQHCSIF